MKDYKVKICEDDKGQFIELPKHIEFKSDEILMYKCTKTGDIVMKENKGTKGLKDAKLNSKDGKYESKNSKALKV